ncbi:S24/S26 family peptidase [uncultured Desulfovibrio sp.]|uniref:S24 family peptidase n=1 Tax=uncultured Desulfovibrio sp. TaxID=167968 RepID=UPI002637314A|nr:S24/S26 family peptidase [uncultured Desulfovibrio sp.]
MLRYIDVLGLDIQDYLPKAATIRRPAPNAPVEKADADGSVAIHVYALAGAGPAFDLEENDPLATIRVPLEYAMQCDSALLVKGDSMAWTIKSGGVVGVIRRNFDFVSGEVYAVRLPYEGLSIKRVIVDAASGEYIIRSDNPDKEKYPDRRLSITEYADIILGRVVWVWQAV